MEIGARGSTLTSVSTHTTFDALCNGSVTMLPANGVSWKITFKTTELLFGKSFSI